MLIGTPGRYPAARFGKRNAWDGSPALESANPAPGPVKGDARRDHSPGVFRFVGSGACSRLRSSVTMVTLRMTHS